MKTKFESGDLVVAKVTAQGVTQGQIYRVVHVAVLNTEFAGVFTHYYLRTASGIPGPVFTVALRADAHMRRPLLELADEEDRDNAEEAESRRRNGLSEDDLKAIRRGMSNYEAGVRLRERDDHWSKL